MSADQARIVARNISKTFNTASGLRKLVGSSFSDYTEVEAVKKMTFAVYAGESVGILGHNGSGKSTLMGLLSGSLKPSTGEVLVSSKPALLGVSAALHDHLSGNKNAYLGLLALGLNPSEARIQARRVIEWAGLEDAAERNFGTYSSGMKARLKFALATSVHQEILLVDEALSTGDSTFNEKASLRMDNFIDRTGTLMLVSHDSSTVQRFCTRAIWVHDGELIADGEVERISKLYRYWSRSVAKGELDYANSIVQELREDYRKPAILLDSEASRYLHSFPG